MKKIVIGELPAGWTECKLGDVCRIKHGYAFGGGEMLVSDDRSLPIVVTIGNFSYEGGFRFGSTPTKRLCGSVPADFRLPAGAVLLIMTCQTPDGAVLGIPGVIPNDGQVYLHNQRMGLAEVSDPKALDSGFLYHLCCGNGFRRFLFETAGGSKVLHTSPGKIEAFPLALPPLPEQRRIAGVLGAWDRALAVLEKLRAAHQQRKQALMQQLLTGKKRLPEFRKLPARIEKLKQFLVEKNERNDGNGVPEVLSVTNDRGFISQVEQFDRLVASKERENYKVVRRGQFAYNPSRVNVGSIALLESFDAGILSPMYVVFETKADSLRAEYMKFFTQSARFRQEVRHQTQGSVRDSLGFDGLCAIKCFVPSIEEQDRIIAVLRAADRQLALLDREAAALRDQKKGLMQQLLTGKVRVKG